MPKQNARRDRLDWSNPAGTLVGGSIRRFAGPVGVLGGALAVSAGLNRRYLRTLDLAMPEPGKAGHLKITTLAVLVPAAVETRARWTPDATSRPASSRPSQMME